MGSKVYSLHFFPKSTFLVPETNVIIPVVNIRKLIIEHESEYARERENESTIKYCTIWLVQEEQNFVRSSKMSVYQSGSCKQHRETRVR